MSSQALANWRKCRAVELVKLGRTYDQIAREVGYANRGTAHRVVDKALSERLSDGIDELRAMEVGRLDALQSALWHKATRGDLRAVGSVLRIIDRRCRLLGLYAHKAPVETPLRGMVLSDEELKAWLAAHPENADPQEE